MFWNSWSTNQKSKRAKFVIDFQNFYCVYCHSMNKNNKLYFWNYQFLFLQSKRTNANFNLIVSSTFHSFKIVNIRYGCAPAKWIKKKNIPSDLPGLFWRLQGSTGDSLSMWEWSINVDSSKNNAWGTCRTSEDTCKGPFIQTLNFSRSDMSIVVTLSDSNHCIFDNNLFR